MSMMDIHKSPDWLFRVIRKVVFSLYATASGFDKGEKMLIVDLFLYTITYHHKLFSSVDHVQLKKRYDICPSLKFYFLFTSSFQQMEDIYWNTLKMQHLLRCRFLPDDQIFLTSLILKCASLTICFVFDTKIKMFYPMLAMTSKKIQE